MTAKELRLLQAVGREMGVVSEICFGWKTAFDCVLPDPAVTLTYDSFDAGSSSTPNFWHRLEAMSERAKRIDQFVTDWGHPLDKGADQDFRIALEELIDLLCPGTEQRRPPDPDEYPTRMIDVL